MHQVFIDLEPLFILNILLEPESCGWQIVTAEEWKAAQSQLLEEEKTATRSLADLAAKRRQLPMVKIENADHFFLTDSDGSKKSLLELFEGRSQLILYDFMLNDQEKEGSLGCSFVMDHVSHLGHLRSRDTTFAAVVSASIDTIAAFKERMEWKFPFYSSKDAFGDADQRKEEITRKLANGFFEIAVF